MTPTPPRSRSTSSCSTRSPALPHSLPTPPGPGGAERSFSPSRLPAIMRQRFTAFAFSLGLALAACSGDKAAGNGGGTVIAGMGTEPSALIPQLVQEETGDAV